MHHTVEIPLAENVTLWMPAWVENLALAVALWEAEWEENRLAVASLVDELSARMDAGRRVRHGHTPEGLSDEELAVLRN